MRAVAIIILCVLAGCASTGSTVDKTNKAEGYYQKGLAYLQDRNYELASVEFNRSIQEDSSNKSSYYSLGLISDFQGKLDDAIKYYKKAISIDGDYSEAYNALGTVYSKQKKWDEALKYYKKALDNKLYPTPHIPYLNMGHVYMAQKDYNNAAEAYRDAKRFVNEDTIIYFLGTALTEAGKSKEAIEELQEGIGIAPQNASLRYALGLAYLKEGNKRSAALEFRKTVELAPKGELANKANEYLKILR